jgi:hypothetical protein
MYISTKLLILGMAAFAASADLKPATKPSGANCKDGEVAADVWFESCDYNMRVAACCPASSPQLAGFHGLPLECVDPRGGPVIKTASPKTPVSCAEGWMPLINLKNICIKGSEVPKAYVDGKCHMV